MQHECQLNIRILMQLKIKLKKEAQKKNIDLKNYIIQILENRKAA